MPLTAIAQPADYIPAPEVPLVYSLTPIGPEQYTPPSNTVLCNCYAYVQQEVGGLPSSGEILRNLSATGTVAVFYYTEVGLHHYAVVRGETDTHYLIEETNYKRCKHGTRKVPKNDPALLGFFHI